MRYLRAPFTKKFWHPARRPGGPLPVITLVGMFAVALVLFLSGVLVGGVATHIYDARYFAARYPHPGGPHPVGARAALPDRYPTLSPAASINLARYPAVGDQDGLGACAAWASMWDLSYEYRITHPSSSLRFSPRFSYDYYSDTYNGGQDGGSWPDQDLAPISITGIPQYKAWPSPPNQIDNPLNLSAIDAWGHTLGLDAAKHRFPISVHAIGTLAGGQGQGLVDGIRLAISANHPIMVAFPVYREYDAATQQWLVTSPTPAEAQLGPRGYHENVAIAYDDALQFPDGTVGGLLLQNQWTTAFGQGGRLWISYDFVRQYMFGAEYITLGAAAPIPKGVAANRFVPNHNRIHPAPVSSRPLPQSTAGLWYVHGVVTHDTHVNVSNLLNYWGDRYDVPPIGLAATAGIESSINQYADRCCIPGDTSYGMMQETTGTTCGYVGVCSNDAVRQYLDNPGNAIALAARYYRDALNEHGNRIGFPNAYILYNAGAGYGDWYYLNPPAGSDAAAHYYYGFLPWWSYVIQAYSGPKPPPPPKPKPAAFPLKAWCAHASRVHVRCISTMWHGKRRYEASLWWRGHVRSAGAIISPPQYVRPAKGRRLGYVTTRFATERLYWWINHPRWIKWIRVTPIR